LIITIVLNTTLLILFAAIPYSQSVYFTSQLKKEFSGKPATVYYLQRSPYATPGGSPLVFYKNGTENLEMKKITYIDSISSINANDIYFAVTYNELKDRRPMLDSLGFKPVIYSSKLLWNINEFLHSKKINTINDIWVLYKKEDPAYVNTISNVVFDFLPKKIQTPAEAIEVNGVLFNNGSDTVCFLTMSCNGSEDLVQFDTTKFELTPFMMCDLSILVVEKIFPGGEYKFVGHLKDKLESSTMKLGFDFVKVDKNIDLKKLNQNILYDKTRKKTILWANEKQIGQ